MSDRPDFTESTQTIEAQHVQLESGSTFAREGEVRSNSIGEVLVRAGLSSKLELRVAGNSYLRERAGGLLTTGMQDANLGLKVRLFDGPDAPSWIPSLSVIAGSTVPTGSTAFRASRAQPEVKVLGAWTLSDRLAFSSNLNASRPYDGVRSFTEYSGSASFGYALNGRMGAYAESFAFAPQDGSGQVQKFVNGGLTFLVSPDLQFDVRAGVGPAARARDYFAGVGLVLRR